MSAEEVLLIEAQQAQPETGAGDSLPPLSCEIRAGKMVFLTALQHSIMFHYLQLLAALEPPTAGKLTILGEDARQLPPRKQRQLRTRAGFVLRGGPLLSVLNGLENLKLAPRYHNLGSEKEIDDRAHALLGAMPATFDEHLLPAYMPRLQRRLLAIARPLMLRPTILFVDSPFEGLDHQDKALVAEYLSTLAAGDGLTLVVASDDLMFARQHAGQVIFCDPSETRVFADWDRFYQCRHKSIALLFEHQNSSQDA